MTRNKKYSSDNPRYEAVKAYKESKKIVRVPLDMPNDEADALRAFCSDHGLTVAGFIRGLIRDAIARASDPATAPGAASLGGDGLNTPPPGLHAHTVRPKEKQS